MRQTAIILGLALLALPGITGPASADYPEKPIKLIVPYGGGGSADMSARLIAKEAEKLLGQSIAIVNIAGGGSGSGTLEASKAPPDGYTLLWQHKSLITAFHTGASKINWDNLTPISNLMLFNEVVHVRKDNKDIDTLEKLIAKGKANPETLRFPVQIGAGAHFSALELAKATGVKFHIIASGGDADRLNEQLGHRADVVFQSITPTLQHIKAGTIIPLGVGAEQRDPGLPDVPTLKEQGYNVVTTFNLGLYGPIGLPEDIVAQWDQVSRKLMENPELQKKMAEISLFPSYMSTKDYRVYLKKLSDNLHDLAEAGGVLK